MRVWLSVSLALLVALSAAIGPATATGQQTTESLSATTQSAASLYEFKTTHTIERLKTEPGTVLVTLTYDIPPTIQRFTVKASQENHTVVSANGLSKQANGDYRWSGSSEDPQLTYKVDVNDSDFGGKSRVDTGRWSLFHTSDVRFSHTFRYTGSEVPYDTEYTVAEGDVGYIDGYVFLGSYSKHNINTRDGAISLIVPAAADAESPEDIARPIRSSANSLRISPRKDNISLIVAPDPIRDGGESIQGAMWVSESATTDSPTNVWIHEYVHERQTWSVSEELSWMTEGSAQYYDHLIPLRQGWNRYSQFHSGITDDKYAGDDLSEPEDWTSYRTQYDGGAMAIALIDTRIRNETNGEKSFQSVMYWMNRHDGELTQKDFFAIVERVVGHSLDEYLRSVIVSRTGMSVPDDPHLYTGVSIRDHDDDGLTNEQEAEAGSHPFISDTDHDGLNDSEELRIGTDPTTADTDGDGEPDGEEADSGTDPLSTPSSASTDTETDGILDGVADLQRLIESVL